MKGFWYYILREKSGGQLYFVAMCRNCLAQLTFHIPCVNEPSVSNHVCIREITCKDVNW